MMVLKRKQLIVAALALIIGVAGFINISERDGMVNDDLNMQASSVSNTYMGEAQMVDNVIETDTTDFFAQARLDREAGRSKSIETFNALISNEDADENVRVSAQQSMIELAENTEIESAIENLIRAKGFSDVVCYINNGQANVIVKTSHLDSSDAVMISEIVTEQSSIPSDKIKIVEIE